MQVYGERYSEVLEENMCQIHMAENGMVGQSLWIQVCLPQRGLKWGEQWVRIKNEHTAEEMMESSLRLTV